jgi:D-glycero-D-manno-heptose 1,7-bisphosphate phosphatase
MSRFVFLDRDGTLVPDVGYPHRLEDYALLPGVVEGLKRLVAASYSLAIVTNQSGIGRGYFDVRAFHAFQELLIRDLRHSDVVIEKSFFCPHLPDAGCGCRKPEPGLLFQARDELGADLGRSWVIGNDPNDAEVAVRAGCRGAVILGDHPRAALPEGAVSAVHLPAAAMHILESDAAPT